MNKDDNINNNSEFENTIYYGDNLDIMKQIINERNNASLPIEFIDLIYIDPPFNSKRDYSVLFEDDKNPNQHAQKVAFTDTWSDYSYKEMLQEIETVDNGKWIKISEYLNFLLNNMDMDRPSISYLSTMAIRIIYMRKLLKPTGSFYLHCDPTMSHYLKIVLDNIFGKENFINEIIWCYSTSGRSKKGFSKKHDIILFYVRDDKKFFWNNDYKIPYSENYIKTHFKDKDDNGKICRKRFDAGKWRTYYPDGMIPNDWWDIPYVNSMADERLGYPTQKPLALLDRILQASSNEGDVVADFFCGCGTTVASAVKNNRHFLGCDISSISISLIAKRIREDKLIKDKVNFKVDGIPTDYDGAVKFFSKDNVFNDGKVNHKRRLTFEDYTITYLLKGVVNEKKSSQGKEHDGYIVIEYDKTKYTCYIECKSGGVTKNDVGRFINDINTLRQTRKNVIGMIIAFDSNITSGFKKDCSDVGYVDERKKLPIVEIIDVKSIIDLNNDIINQNTSRILLLGDNTTYKGGNDKQVEL